MPELDFAKPDVDAVVLLIMSAALGDRYKSFPWYCSDIHSEAQAESAWADLPLVYTWNEVVVGNQVSYTLSANGGRIAAMLEQYLPRTHPDFARIRDTVTERLCQSQNQMLRSLCKEFGSTPSRLSATLAE